jgi:S-DNA-T family DNA segregation ATPase FtsK/SpoIIIE
VADAADSIDILGTPAAAHLDPDVPGRAIARIGPGRVVTFQAAYAGARSGAVGAAVARIGVRDCALTPSETWANLSDQATKVHDGPSDVTRVVRSLQEAACAARLAEPRRPWLDELAEVYDLAPLVADGSRGMCLGLLDDPGQQEQRPFAFDPETEGNLVIYGAAGSGKSVALRTVAASASLGEVGAPVHIYGIDGANGGLDLLAPLPNVGSIIDAEDEDRVRRLLRMLESTIAERAARFGAVQAANLSEYRAVSADTFVARVLVLIDGLGAVQEAYVNAPWRAPTFDALRRVMAEGRSVGVHVIASADRPGALHSSVQAQLSRSITLRQFDDGQYALLGLRKPPLSADCPPGRAVDLTSGKEWQVALLGGERSVKAQAAALEELGTKLAGRAEWSAPDVPRMPAVVTVADLAELEGGPAVVGMEADSLDALPLDLGRPLMIAGQAGTGRSTALRWVCREVNRVEPASRMVLISQRQGALAVEPWWDTCATSLAGAMDVLPQVTESLERDTLGESRCVIVLEALHDVPGSLLEAPLLAAVKRAKRHGHLVIGEAETSGWMSGLLASEIRSARHGIVMAPDPQDGLMLMGTQLPRLRRADMPLGRAVYVRSGRASVVQVPYYLGELSTGSAADQRAFAASR